MIKVILIIFLLTASASFSACKYSATADVKDNQLVNKVEKYVCEEDVSFFVKFWTTDEWVRPATYTFLFILDNL